MKSAMISRQGSMSRLQGPRSLEPVGDGSPRRRAAKSVKFDKRDEIIQYIAATPDISEENWDHMSLESCDSDLDHRPLPSLPKFTMPQDPREERLLQTPRFQAKLGAPLTEGDDEFDFGAPNRVLDKLESPVSNAGSADALEASQDSDENKEGSRNEPRTLLPSPFLHERSPVIDRPSMDVRMDAIMDGGSGLSPSLKGNSWHRRTGSQMSDFSDGGNEAYFPVKKLPRPEEENEDSEPASWRDRNDLLVARQDSLQEDQRHLPTVKLSKKPLPGPADLDRTYSRRKQKLLQMLDPHGAGVNQSQAIATIMEEVEENEENDEDHPSLNSAHSLQEPSKAYKSPLDISLGDDSYWHPDSDASEASSPADMTADSTVNLTANMTANQSIGISNEPAARYAAGLAKGLVQDSDISGSTTLASPSKSVPGNILPPAGEELSPISPVESVYDRRVIPETSSDSEMSRDIEYIHPSDINTSYDMSQLTTPSRLQANSRELSYEVSRLPYYNTTELGDLSDEEPSRITNEELSEDLPETISCKFSAESPVSTDQASRLASCEHESPTLQDPPPISPNKLTKEEPSTPRVDTSSPKSLRSLQTDNMGPRPRHNAYPGVLPWDPSMDTTVDNLAAMPTPIIPKRSPERKRRSLMLDRPLQSKPSEINRSIVSPGTSPERVSPPEPEREHEEQALKIPMNQWEPEIDDKSGDDDTDAESLQSRENESALSSDNSEKETRDVAVSLASSPASGGMVNPGSEKPADRSTNLAEVNNSSPSVENCLQTQAEEQVDGLYVMAKDFDPDVLSYMANQPDESVEAPTSTAPSPEKVTVTLQQRPSPGRKDSTASLRDKRSFVPLALPSLSPIDISTSPFMNVDNDLKRPLAPQNRHIDAIVSPVSVQPPLASSKHAKIPSISPSVATDNGDTSILKDMSFNTEELSRFQQDNTMEKRQHEFESNDEDSVFPTTASKSLPVLDSDLSDFEDQNNSPRELPEIQAKGNFFESPRIASTKNQDEHSAKSEHEANVDALEAGFTLKDEDVSIRRPSFGENMASTMMSLFSDQMELDSADDDRLSLNRVSSRHTYKLRESDSYVIATGPRRNRQKLSRAYEVFGSDEPEYPIPQHAIQRSQALPSNNSFGASSTAQPPSDISKSGSSVYSMTRGSSTGSVPQPWGPAQNRAEKAPLSIIEEPEEESKSRTESPIEAPQIRTSNVSDNKLTNQSRPELNDKKIANQDRITETTKRNSNYDTISESPAKPIEQQDEVAQPFATGFDRHFNASQASLPRHAGEILLPTPMMAPWVSSNNLASISDPSTAKGTGSPRDSPPIDEGKVPNGLLYLIIEGIDSTQIPSDTLISLQVDNGFHCITSKVFPASKLSQFSKEYRIGITEGHSVYITLRLSLEHTSAHKFRKLGCDGSFAKFDLYSLRKTAFGNPSKNGSLNGYNVWDSDTKPVVATAKYTALYIPCVSPREDAPQTFKGAISRLARAREEMRSKSPLAQGPLRQYGGDLKSRVGKQRYLVLDPVSPLLVAHSVRTRRPRTLINLAKATEVTPTGNESLEIHFRNHDTLMFYAANSAERGKWISALKPIIGRSEGARPKWVDAILYDSR